MADFVENICNHGLETIQGWYNTYQLCWQNALKREGLPPDTKIAVFSEDNLAAKFLDRIYQNWIDAQRDFACLGYVGLCMDSRHIPKIKKTRRKASE